MLRGKSIKHSKDGAADRVRSIVFRISDTAGHSVGPPIVAAARPPDLFNRAKHLFDSAKVVAASRSSRWRPPVANSFS
jgi:hypothetical protein